MGMGLVLLLFTFFHLGIATFAYVWYRKSSISFMTGMTVVMASAMSISLCVGTLLATFYQGELLLTTLLGMATGVGIGTLVGLPLHPLSVIEGWLAGMMGGMMGAMLGDMLPVEQGVLLIRILFTFTVLLHVTLLFVIRPSNQESEIQSYTWFMKPITLFITFFALFIIVDSWIIHSIPVELERVPQQEHQHFHSIQFGLDV